MSVQCTFAGLKLSANEPSAESVTVTMCGVGRKNAPSIFLGTVSEFWYPSCPTLLCPHVYTSPRVVRAMVW